MLIYSLILLLRHFFYDKGWIKSTQTEIPSICIGNISAGGTGKTPMTELVVRTLLEDESVKTGGMGFGSDSLFFHRNADVAVLSRGYKRKSKGFCLVDANGLAEQYGDEPLQIKRKFPDIVVAVDEDRAEGCERLAHPSDEDGFGRPDVIILDDAFQHRRVKANRNIVLTTFNRPYFKDFLLPLGRLRDLRRRARKADMLVVTKCPSYLTDEERMKWASRIGLKDYNVETFEGTNKEGKVQKLLFSTVEYDSLQPVFSDSDPRYTHSKAAILFTGIANDSQLALSLSENYQLHGHLRFPDHHFFDNGDVQSLNYAACRYPIAVLVTTEKDAQRLRDIRLKINEDLRHKMFYAPIRARMLTPEEQDCLKDFVTSL